jgi:serine phosphatase RsbU (regulator of sigma subunit)
VQGQRERTARIAGELEAAQRIQTASLPRPDLLRGDGRADLYAALTPAREVGGDLYDYFMLDEDRLFLLIGDVAGKGLSASIFMAVSKALYKGLMIRTPGADIGAIMTAANAEVSRDNVEMLFVTVFAAILDLHSGELDYCNAGHENPLLIRPGGAGSERITDGDGPPLCAMSDFDYRSAHRLLAPGELLCLMTDGVTEAQNPEGALYGHARAKQVIAELCRGGASARELVTALQADVVAFEDGAEPNDDLTVIALRWNRPSSDAAPAPHGSA